jgi:hypothetical protein
MNIDIDAVILFTKYNVKAAKMMNGNASKYLLK